MHTFVHTSVQATLFRREDSDGHEWQAPHWNSLTSKRCILSKAAGSFFSVNELCLSSLRLTAPGWFCSGHVCRGHRDEAGRKKPLTADTLHVSIFPELLSSLGGCGPGMQPHGSENVRRRAGATALASQPTRPRRGSPGVHLKPTESLAFWLAGGARGRPHAICRQSWAPLPGHLGPFLSQPSAYLSSPLRDTRGPAAGSAVLRPWGRPAHRSAVHLLELKALVAVAAALGVAEVVAGGCTAALLGGLLGRWLTAPGSWHKLAEVLALHAEFLAAAGQDVLAGGAGALRPGRALGGPGHVPALARPLVERAEGTVTMSLGYDMTSLNGRDPTESSDDQGTQSPWCGL